MGAMQEGALWFVAAGAVGGVMGAVGTNGWQSRVLWALALLFALATVVAIRAKPGSVGLEVLWTVWTFAPIIGAAFAFLITTGRKPLERKALPLAPPTLNPGLTTRYVEAIVKSSTNLEAQGRIEAHRHQRAKLVGQVRQIRRAIYPAGVRVDAAFPGVDRAKDLHFKKGQDDALAVIKIGDWIEFTGRIDHSDAYGWEMSQCEFVGLAQPPKITRSRTKGAP